MNPARAPHWGHLRLFYGNCITAQLLPLSNRDFLDTYPNYRGGGRMVPQRKSSMLIPEGGKRQSKKDALQLLFLMTAWYSIVQLDHNLPTALLFNTDDHHHTALCMAVLFPQGEFLKVELMGQII